jgi:RNA polymerase sigma-70 factor (ECF subfamily)
VTATEQLTLDERRLCEGLRCGDDQAFAELVEAYHRPLRRVALGIVRSPAVADEVVQETWLAVIRGIDAFEGRSSLKTWLFRILINKARTRAERERRTIPFSSVATGDEGPAVDQSRFLDGRHERWPGHWASPPARWDEVPEQQLLGREALKRIGNAIDRLPPAQREVIVLRDVEGWASDEVCAQLGVSEANQRVLLHRARSKVRRSLETYFA